MILDKTNPDGVEERHKKIIELHNELHSYTKTAEAVGYNKSTVGQIVKRAKKRKVENRKRKERSKYRKYISKDGIETSCISYDSK